MDWDNIVHSDCVYMHINMNKKNNEFLLDTKFNACLAHQQVYYMKHCYGKKILRIMCTLFNREKYFIAFILE